MGFCSQSFLSCCHCVSNVIRIQVHLSYFLCFRPTSGLWAWPLGLPLYSSSPRSMCCGGKAEAGVDRESGRAGWLSCRGILLTSPLMWDVCLSPLTRCQNSFHRSNQGADQKQMNIAAVNSTQHVAGWEDLHVDRVYTGGRLPFTPPLLHTFVITLKHTVQYELNLQMYYVYWLAYTHACAHTQAHIKYTNTSSGTHILTLIPRLISPMLCKLFSPQAGHLLFQKPIAV